jgi:hypothetical protein
MDVNFFNAKAMFSDWFTSFSSPAGFAAPFCHQVMHAFNKSMAIHGLWA